MSILVQSQPHADHSAARIRVDCGPSEIWTVQIVRRKHFFRRDIEHMASMLDLALMLGRKTGIPVVDRTGLTGRYNWYLKHPVEQPPNHSPVVGVLNPSDRSFLFKAVEQLGL
jgi:uncharacterized protein (TIGR03435 family)